MALAIRFLLAPMAGKDFTRRSTDTVGSPLSMSNFHHLFLVHDTGALLTALDAIVVKIALYIFELAVTNIPLR
jgi:hypothetical protein